MPALPTFSPDRAAGVLHTDSSQRTGTFHWSRRPTGHRERGRSHARVTRAKTAALDTAQGLHCPPYCPGALYTSQLFPSMSRSTTVPSEDAYAWRSPHFMSPAVAQSSCEAEGYHGTGAVLAAVTVDGRHRSKKSTHCCHQRALQARGGGAPAPERCHRMRAVLSVTL